jgi:hypothetical protein
MLCPKFSFSGFLVSTYLNHHQHFLNILTTRSVLHISDFMILYSNRPSFNDLFSSDHFLNFCYFRTVRDHISELLFWKWFDRYYNRQFGFEPRTFRLRDLVIYFGIQTGVGDYSVWLWKSGDTKLFWKKGDGISLQRGGTRHGVCPRDSTLEFLTVIICRREGYVATHPKRFVYCKLRFAELKLEPPPPLPAPLGFEN